MALNDWGPLSGARKQSEISAAFEAVKNKVDLDNLDKVKQAIYDELKKKYKLNQAKFKTWEKFWANANYEKHLIYLQSLVDTETEARGYVSASRNQQGKSGNSNSNGNGNGNGNGDGSGSGMSTWLIVAVVAVIVVLLIKKFRKK